MSALNRGLSNVDILLVMALLAPSVHAQDAESGGMNLEPWSVEESALPIYPSRASSSGAQGYVDLVFMVGTNGEASDPQVVRSMGHEDFGNTALRALGKMRFNPATVDGKPVASVGTYRYHYTLEGPRGNPRRFTGLYDAFNKVLAEGDREAVDEALEALEAVGSSNHREHAYLHFARFNYAQKYGNALEQMHNLHGALSFADTAEEPLFMPAAAQQGLWRALLALQIQNQFFADALDTWAIIQAKGDEEAEASFARPIQAIETVRSNDAEMIIEFSLPESGELWHSLFKRRLYISGGEGEVAKMALYCDAGHTELQLERDFDYELPAALGSCEAQISGDPGASFFLVQH